MWRNLKSPSLCVQFKVICCILHCFVAKFVFFLRFKLFCRKIELLRFTRYCMEKMLKNDKYQVTKTSILWVVGQRGQCPFKKLFYRFYTRASLSFSGILFQILGVSVTTCICIFNVSAFLQICIIRQSFSHCSISP